MDNKPKKPKFGLWEQIKTVASGEVYTPDIKTFLKHPKSHLRATRSRVAKVLSQKRLPYRNPDGSMNWPNYFAAEMQVAEPIKRADVFPNRIEDLSDDEIFGQVAQYVAERSAKWNPGPSNTGYDPVEFPEVIGPSMRGYCDKINSLPFVRTTMSFTGSPRAGYTGSALYLTIDSQHPKSKDFIEELQKLCGKYENKNVKPIIMGELNENLGFFHIRLHIDTPADWKENDLPAGTLTPKEYKAQLIPGIFTKKGYINRKVYYQACDDGRVEQCDSYEIDYNQKKNVYGVSDQCKSIYENFWSEVGKGYI